MTTHAVDIDGVVVGGGAPVVVQSMTNTATEDIRATIRQVGELAQAGSELVRITVNSEEAARAVPEIRDGLEKINCRVPLVGDFHFNGHRLLSDYPECARALAKYRINPGNVGSGEKKDAQFATMIELACRHDKAVRIGVNWGSLDKQLVARMMDENATSASPLESEAVMHEIMIVSALESARRAEEIGLAADKIVISCKMSGVQDLVSVYQQLAQRCSYALHLGLTEAGMGSRGIVGAGGIAAAGHRRHHPRLPDPRAWRAAHPRGGGRPADSADAGTALLHTHGHRLSGVWTHHQHLFPGTGERYPGVSP